MHYKLVRAVDGPDSLDDAARATSTRPIVLRKEPTNPKQKFIKLKP
jgi:hypothetical protein